VAGSNGAWLELDPYHNEDLPVHVRKLDDVVPIWTDKICSYMS
jgi:hypothetical protein